MFKVKEHMKKKNDKIAVFLNAYIPTEQGTIQNRF